MNTSHRGLQPCICVCLPPVCFKRVPGFNLGSCRAIFSRWIVFTIYRYVRLNSLIWFGVTENIKCVPRGKSLLLFFGPNINCLPGYNGILQVYSSREKFLNRSFTSLPYKCCYINIIWP